MAFDMILMNVVRQRQCIPVQTCWFEMMVSVISILLLEDKIN